MADNGAGIQIAVALIGVIGPVLGGVISRPRAPAPPPPQPMPGPAGAAGPTAAPQPGPVPAAAKALKISKAFWWGVTALVLSVTPAAGLGFIAVAPALWIGTRDIRSPGTRRLVKAGLGLAVVALVICIANPNSGFQSGFKSGYNSTNG